MAARRSRREKTANGDASTGDADMYGIGANLLRAGRPSECPDCDPPAQPAKTYPETPAPPPDNQPLRTSPETPVIPDSHPEAIPVEYPD